MSIEIRKVVRQIIAPATVFVPCIALMASAPAYAAAQHAGPGATSTPASSAPPDQR